MSKKFLENLFEKLLADKCVRDTVEKLRDNANELGAFIARQISACAVNDALADASDAPTAQSRPVELRDKRTANWEQASDAALRAAVFYRKKRGLPIGPELNKVLSARFPGWDATTQKFTHIRSGNKSATSNSPTQKPHRQRVTDWGAASDATLRTAFYYRKKNNLPIEPELNSELSARFPGWDAAAQKFTRARPVTPEKSVEKTNTSPAPKITDALVPLYSSTAGNKKFSLFFDNGVSRNRILSRAGEPYELCLFDMKTNYAVVRKICDGGQSRLYVIDCASGNIVPETKTGVSYVCWLNGSHDLFALQKTDSLRSGWHLMGHGRIARPVVIPAHTKMIRAGAIGNETILLDAGGVAHIGDMVYLSDLSGATNQNDTIKKILVKPVAPEMPLPEIMAPAPESVATQSVATNAPAATTPGADTLLRITVKPVRTTLQGTYNNIMVNGRKILSNHFDSEIRLFSNNEILAIRGIVTDDKSLPETIQWRVYYADLTSAVPSVKQSYSSYNAHACAVYQMPDGGVRIDMSNRSSVFPKVDRIRKIANGRRFVLDEKHR